PEVTRGHDAQPLHRADTQRRDAVARFGHTERAVVCRSCRTLGVMNIGECMGNAYERIERTESAQALALDLESVLLGRMELALVLSHREKYGEAIDACLHGLNHFLADEDVRSKDADYKAMQEAAMRRLISLLRSGASAVELSAEDFLR
ncbi:SMIM14 family protein, partial [Methylibium rhizosphaerae]|uniref:SMIM14 family protein n=1 Tax=Methylibium rhizosphaerae TaxID=2570323 RepID=UPI001C6148D6